MNIRNAKVLITGGNSGRNETTLQETAKALHVDYIKADVTQENQVQDMVQEAKNKMNGLNVLINNAGYGYISKLIDIEADKFIDQFKTNILGATLCAKESAKHFVAQEYGNIINIGSTSSLKGSPTASPYVATKFALRGMTESWRNELRPHNIRVMQVNPSEVMTSFSDNRIANNSKAKQYTEAEQQTKLRGEEIAHTISSLLEMDDRGFITEATVFATNPKV